MTKSDKLEVWLRGPVENIPALLQPVAHALLQAKEEVAETVADFPNDYLWQKTAGVASAGFHLRHLTGVLDRLLTYARGEALNSEQLNALSSENKAVEGKDTIAVLLQQFNEQVDRAIYQLRSTDEQSFTEPRMVGRAQIPSTVFGLLVHAAEHTMRHVGQLYVTVKVIQDKLKKSL